MKPEPWKLISSNKNQTLRIFSLRTDRALSPRTQKEHDFYILESNDWINVIPLTPRNEVVLIRQYRHGIRENTLEIPGGIIEMGDSPATAAQRELREETGYRESEMVLLGSVYANPAFLNNKCYSYVALDVFPEGNQDLDDKEDIEIVLMPLDDIPRLIRDGEITHSLVLAAFYRFYMEYLPEANI
ncbi:MAG: NUDIX hydrolase [Deltaproteobacteria bacterium]|nr:NUDIX hydrolase [Deltaproteobacteria bacterium]